MGKSRTLRSQSRTYSSIDQNPTDPGLVLTIPERNAHILEYLKELHPDYSSQDNTTFLAKITHSLLDFFNRQKKYTSIELEYNLIHLGHLLHIHAGRRLHLPLGCEFNNKIRRTLKTLSQSNIYQSSSEYQTSIVCYILVGLIANERRNLHNKQQKNSKTRNSNSVFKDSGIAITFASMPLYSNIKLHKLYGIIMSRLTTQHWSFRVKKVIIRSLLRNLHLVENQKTVINLLGYIRRQKQKIQIDISDLEEGKIMDLLCKTYPKRINHYQSYYILDFIHYILKLDCRMQEDLIKTQLVSCLVQSLSRQLFHHPLHEATIYSVVRLVLINSDQLHRKILIQGLNSSSRNSLLSYLKIYKIVIQFISEEELAQKVIENGFIDELANYYMANNYTQIRQISLNIILISLKKIVKFNTTLALHVSNQLKTRFSILKENKFVKDLEQFERELRILKY